MLYNHVPGYSGVKVLGDLQTGDTVLAVFNTEDDIHVSPAKVEDRIIKKLPVFIVHTEAGRSLTLQKSLYMSENSLDVTSGIPPLYSFLFTLRHIRGAAPPLEGKSIVPHYGGKEFKLEEVPRTRDFGWMFGVFLGVGGFIGKSAGTAVIQRAQGRAGIASLWALIIEQLADVRPIEGSPDKLGYNRHLRVSNGTLCRWLRYMVGGSAKERKLPPGTLTSEAQFREGVFLGLMETRGTIRVAPRNTKVSIRIKNTDALHQQVIYLCMTLGLEATSRATCVDIRPDSICTDKAKGWLKFSGNKLEQYNNLLDTAYKTPAPSMDYIPCTSDVVNYVTQNVLMGMQSNKFVGNSMHGGILTKYTTDALSAIIADNHVLSNLPDYMKRWCIMAVDPSFGYDRVISIEELGSMEVPMPVIDGAIGFVLNDIVHTTHQE